MFCICPHCSQSFKLEAVRKPGKSMELAEQIIRLVCEHMGVTESQLINKNRHIDIANARHIAIALILKWAGLNLSQTGKLVNRDHTTVIFSRTKIHNICFTKQDPYEDFHYLDIQCEVMLISEKEEEENQEDKSTIINS